jgi:hypothetical protein
VIDLTGEEKIEDYRTQLFNSLYSNDFVNLQKNDNMVEIENPSFSNVYKKLVLENEKLSVYPKSFKDSPNYPQLIPHKVIERNQLIGLYDKKDLDDHISRIFNQSNQKHREQENQFLCLTLGLLKWKISENSSASFKSPIILIPIKMIKRDNSSLYQIQCNDGEIFTNYFLKEKLHEYGIDYPEFKYSTTNVMKKYFFDIQEIIKKHPGWEVRNDLFLHIFKFKRYDLSKNDPVIELPFTSRRDMISYLESERWEAIDKWKPLIYYCRNLDLIKIIWKIWKKEEAKRQIEKPQPPQFLPISVEKMEQRKYWDNILS